MIPDMSGMILHKNNCGYLVFVFTLVFGVVFYDVIQRNFGFSLIDEFVALFLFVLWLQKGKKSREFFLFFVIALFYLVYSLLFPNNEKNAIFLDFFIQIKPYIAFYTVYNLNLDFSEKQRRSICRLCIALIVLLIPVGIAGWGGTGVMRFFGGHSRFATMCTALAMTYLLFSNKSKKAKIISLVILTVGLASLRSKLFGFYPFFIAFVFWGDRFLRRKKIISLRAMVVILIVAASAVFLAKDKLEFYFVKGSSHAKVEQVYARPLLYMKAKEILLDYPILGTGLGSYATFASAEYYSPLYKRYNLIYNNEIGKGLFICDTFYPSFVQFGLVGIFLYLLFWKRRLTEARSRFEMTQTMFSFQYALLITIFFIIEGVADSTFTHNRGMYMLMLLALSISNSNLVSEKE